MKQILRCPACAAATKVFFTAIFLLCLLCTPSFGTFVPDAPTLPAGKLRAGMTGYALTVMRGTKPVRLPVEIVSVIPHKGSVGHYIMVRFLPSPENSVGGVAQGMSGSPVYIDGKLIGAVGMGWNFSDHKTALVTPIEDMCEVFSRPGSPVTVKGLPGASRRALPLTAGGLSEQAVATLKTALSSLNIPVEAAPQGAAGELPVAPKAQERLSPGEAVAVLLAWGDVELAATGTVTATAKDGRFLAFGHPFMERGAVNFPAARAFVHDTIFSHAFPFKVASPAALVGTVTQDRQAGIGGLSGYFTPSIPAELAFQDLDAPGASKDRSMKTMKNFRVVPDAFLGAKLLEGIYAGLLSDQWGRRGQGTASVILRVEGRGVTQGWTRANTFFSDSDIAGAAVRESAEIMEMFLLQPFKEIYPIGFRLDVSVTQEPKVLFIEDVTVSQDAAPGDTLDVSVTLRPWRRAPVKKHFELTVPKDATGICELIVRGGGTNSLSQLAVEGGWKSIDGFERMMTEIEAMDANNELIVELSHDQAGKAKSGGNAKAELLPEEKEFLSETKARRIKEGTLRISRSEYVVDGMMKRMINLGGTDSDKKAATS